MTLPRHFDVSLNTILKESLPIIKEAADLLKHFYEAQLDLNIQHKSDASPVTTADHEASRCLEQGLAQLKPACFVISEESVSQPTLPLPADLMFWLVDPLDGTREFIQRTGEFSINVSLVYHHEPILGIIQIPMKNQLYWAIREEGAFFQDGHNPPVRLQVKTPGEELVIAISRSHHSHENPNWQRFIRWAESLNKPLRFKHSGSAIKLGWVAHGLADIYPRCAATSAWDTAAGHCILQEAGGCIIDLQGNPLKYGASKSLQNPHFLATTPAYREAWLSFLQT